MKRLLSILMISLLQYSQGQQQALKTYSGAYTFEGAEGTATFTYTEQKGEKILEGSFTFKSTNSNLNISGKYSNGNKNGQWTKKESYSRYYGMPVVKSELKWQKVTEEIPFKEITEVTTSNYVNNKLEGVLTQSTTVKNSWGSPAPGGASTSVISIKKVYASDELKSVEGSRKEKEKQNLSVKGNYNNKLAEGTWLFTDSKKNYNYQFKSGNLTSYEIKEIGSGKLIDNKKIEADTASINEYYRITDNNCDVMHGTFLSELKEGKIIIKNINENLKIIKLCKRVTEAVSFPDLDFGIFSNAFGISYPKTANIKCETFPTNEWDKDLLLDKLHFTSVKSENSFLTLTTNSNGEFLNTDWSKISRFSNARHFLQLKSYMYRGDTARLRSYLVQFSKNENFENYLNYSPMPNGKYVSIGSSEKEYYDYLKFLAALSLGDINKWKAACNSNYNRIFKGQRWQDFIVNHLDTLSSLTSFKYNKNLLQEYLNEKQKEIDLYNKKQVDDIKEVKIGDQVWMSQDLRIIPNKTDYFFYPKDSIKKLLPTSNGNETAENLGNYYRIGLGNYEYAYVSSKITDPLSTPKYFNDESALKLCPDGWRLPTEKDWDKLNANLGGDKASTDKFLITGGGSGFEASELEYLYLNSKENKPWIFMGFKQSNGEQNYGSSIKIYARCRCLKE
ncbi:MAG: FISUMP domain-containing protein [Bacteroidota bacterium]|jgi:uncharacterized protein (TIGR02145 family)